MGPFFHDLVVNWVSEILVVVGGLMLALLRKYKDDWAPVVGYGLGGAACIALLIFAITGRAIFSTPITNSSNIEDNVKKWVASFGYGSEAVPPPSQNMDFAYRISMPNGSEMLVYRDIRNRPGYLQLQASLSIAPEHRAILEKLTTAQAAGVVEQTQNGILSRKLSYFFLGKDPNDIESITITKAVVINGLTESGFGDAMDDIESTVALTRNQFLLAIQPYSKAPTLHPVPQ
ncbi:MAG: DUF2299 family protein [Acidobacteriaceae bacterium]